MKKTLFTLAFVFLATSAFSGFFSCDPIPADTKVLEEINNEIQNNLDKVYSSNNKKLEIIKVFTDAADECGYSVDATIREWFKKSSEGDMAWLYRAERSGLSDLYGPVVGMALSDSDVLIEAGAMTTETLEYIKGL